QTKDSARSTYHGCKVNGAHGSEIFGGESGEVAGNHSGGTVKINMILGKRSSQDLVYFVTLHQKLKGKCTQAGDKVEINEPLRTQNLLDHRTEHKQSEHIEEQMGKVAMHKHVGNDLPGMKHGRIRIIYPEQLVRLGKNHGTNEADEIEYKQVFNYGRQVEVRKHFC